MNTIYTLLDGEIDSRDSGLKIQQRVGEIHGWRK
ncbi:hypothetical protein QFZ28_001041 [Neobacillus niacini]|nr:hypothetical protein [Neobacillus niacini]